MSLPHLLSEAPAISIRHLWHRFGSRDVLRDVNLEIGHGEIFGFIGPNGAGKTTTIRIMATLLEPMAGRVEVDGIDVAIDAERVRRLIGYMPDHAGVYERITVREYLEFFADAYRVPEVSVVDASIELTDLGRLVDRQVVELSKGMKQRLQLARILLHDPKVLILDEPASDLDPRARIEMRDLLLELRDLGKTIFLSSHILTELSDVCTSIGILEKGSLVVAGPIAEIAERLAQQRAAEAVGLPSPDEAPRTERLPGSPEAPALATIGGVPLPAAIKRKLKLRVLADAGSVAPLLAGGAGVLQVEPGAGGQLLVTHTGNEQFVADVVKHLVAQGVPVVGVEPERNELERIFLEVTRGELQ